MRKGFKKLQKRVAQVRGVLNDMLRYQYQAIDLAAVQQIDVLPVSPDGQGVPQGASYISQGEDPYFRLRSPLVAGWYMVEVQMLVPAGTAHARFYLDIGDGESEAMSFALPIHSGRMAKRLLWVTAPARLRFDPMTQQGAFTLQHFRLVRMFDSLAKRRMHKKLELRMLNTRGSLVPQLQAASPPKLCDSWRDYNAIFEPVRDDAVTYARWIEEVEAHQIPSLEQQQAEMQTWSWLPEISIVLPTYNTPESLLRECLDSVVAQTYPHWQLCIADDASTQPHVQVLIRQYATMDKRIHYVLRPTNGHISASSNSALALATGEFVALLDHDDTLAPHALFTVAQCLQEQPSAQVIYSDEDKLDPEGRRCDPFFKPDWAPDLLFSQNYMAHLLVYQRQLLSDVGGFRTGYEGSQDYDLLLRCIARIAAPGNVIHIPKVLYHWRMAEGSTATGHAQKDYATAAAQQALQDHMDSCHPGVRVEVTRPGIYRARWPLPGSQPLVSLIIPTRNGFDHLRTCIESIREKTTYTNYEILVVDNQSDCDQTLTYLRHIEVDADYGGRVRVLKYDHPFNYSAINNFAASQARGSVLGLINNDVEVINGDWLSEMVSHALRPNVGCVGAKLYYPDGTLQHAGVVLGIGGVAGHSHKYSSGSDVGYFGRLLTAHNVSAVTGAVLLVRKAVFEEAGMLDEEYLKVAFNDVDFCLKVREAGYLNIWTPFAELFHHESKTRGDDDTPHKAARFASECVFMKDRWGELLRNDPFYNKNLTLSTEDYAISLVGSTG